MACDRRRIETQREGERMTKKKYSLTDEHKAQLPAWHARGLAKALSTEPMTEDDRKRSVKAVLEMYAAANLPAPKNIVFVPSPFVLRFAGGFAAAIWYLRRNSTRSATWSATANATESATWSATANATESAIANAIESATRSAIANAT